MDDPTNLVVECPHCKDPVLIEKLNCRIFRHGAFKSNGQQIYPHANQKLCETYINNQLIFGCGKPFQIIEHKTENNDKNTYIAVICDYI